jgi:branched-chain amino acid transport system ATP-binding protein
MPELETRGLSKAFGGVHALEEVDFVARSGEITGLIGPNGSGKSTLFNVATGFFRPTAGSVHWDGREITRVPAHKRAGLGVVRTFQERMVFGGTTVEENLRFALIRAGVHRPEPARLRAGVESVGLPLSCLTQHSADLSWGQIRLLGVALALILEPRMLLLDEPFAGLNARIAKELAEILLRLRSEGVGLVVVEHDMELLLPLCDRVVVLARGRKIADGSSASVIEQPEVRAAYFGETVNA